MRRHDSLALITRPEPRGRDTMKRTPEARLKALLKAMLRTYGWRCTAARPAADDDAEGGEEAGST